MITTQTHGDITWVDAQSPTEEEIMQLRDTYAIDAEIARDLISPTIHPRLDECIDHVYMVLHFPAYKHSHQAISQEIDFVIGKKYLITVRYDTIDSVHWFSKAFEVTSALSKNQTFADGPEVFAKMLGKMYRTVFDELNALEEKLDGIEDDIFNEKEKEMVAAISNVGRTLLDFKRTLFPHEEALCSLEALGVQQFGKKFAKQAENVHKEYTRLLDRIIDDIEAMRELRETNNTLLYAKQNETMKIFTVLAFTTFPLSLIASIFSSVDSDLLWPMLAVMVIGIIFMLGFFKYKKWL